MPRLVDLATSDQASRTLPEPVLKLGRMLFSEYSRHYDHPVIPVTNLVKVGGPADSLSAVGL